jgi:beta-xylosidase
MMARSRDIYGPYEDRQLIHVDKVVTKESNQGGLIQLPSGDWYFLTHQGTGDWEERAVCLLPVSWVDGWPIPGAIGEDGIGTMVWRDRKPIDGFPVSTPQAGDEFDGPVLAPQWE